MTSILIVGPSWVGDTVMAQSLFRLIKEQTPDAVIDVLAPTWTFSLLARMPEVSEAIPMPIAHGELKLRATTDEQVSRVPDIASPSTDSE